jgi:hypothetical protein
VGGVEDHVHLLCARHVITRGQHYTPMRIAFTKGSVRSF